MRQCELFAEALGLTEPWEVVGIEFSPEDRRIVYSHRFCSGQRLSLSGMWRGRGQTPRYGDTHLASPGFLSTSGLPSRPGTAGTVLWGMWYTEGRGSLVATGQRVHVIV